MNINDIAIGLIILWLSLGTYAVYDHLKQDRIYEQHGYCEVEVD